MSNNDVTPESTRRSRRRRYTRQILKRKIAADSAEPIKLPPHILWCGTDSDTVTQWLLHSNLPWWFFGAFLNYCARVGDKGHPRHTTRPRYTVAQRRLLACLGQFELSAGELIEVMKTYRRGGATWELRNKGLLFNLRELSRFRFPSRSAKRILTGYRERYKPRVHFVPRPESPESYHLSRREAQSLPVCEALPACH